MRTSIDLKSGHTKSNCIVNFIFSLENIIEQCDSLSIEQRCKSKVK